MPTEDNTQILVAIAEIKGAIQQALGGIESLRGVDTDHESRIRQIEAQPIPDPSTAQRLRALEDRHTISPGQLWGGLIGLATVLGGVAAAVALVWH